MCDYYSVLIWTTVAAACLMGISLFSNYVKHVEALDLEKTRHENAMIEIREARNNGY